MRIGKIRAMTLSSLKEWSLGSEHTVCHTRSWVIGARNEIELELKENGNTEPI